MIDWALDDSAVGAVPEHVRHPGEVNRLFDSFLGRPSGDRVAERTWPPVLDMHETKDDLVLSFEFPASRTRTCPCRSPETCSP